MASETAFDENEVYDILRNERRRSVLRYLDAREGETEVTIGDLADAIAAEESNESPPPSDVRQSVYVSLHQTHLPKLDNLGVVWYDRDERTIELRPAAGQVLAHLDGGGTDDGRSTAVATILVVAAVGLLATLGALAGIPVLAGVGAGVWGTVALAVVIAIAVVRLVRPDAFDALGS